MKILMLSWKDLKHPKRGGAEVFTDVYLEELAKRGHQVTLLTSSVKNTPKKEAYKGYTILRKGNEFTVYFYGFFYAFRRKNKLDIIIDQINTLPFFTPLIISKPKRVAFLHQLCK